MFVVSEANTQISSSQFMAEHSVEDRACDGCLKALSLLPLPNFTFGQNFFNLSILFLEEIKAIIN